MPTYYARKAGNINAADVWATAPAGTASAVTFAAGDVLMANSFAITVNVSTDLGATGEVRNDTANGATNGGSFTLSNGVTLTANAFASSVACVVFSGSAGSSAFLVGNCTGGTGASSGWGANNTLSGTLNITGNCVSGTAGNYPDGARNSGSGTLNITGSCVGGVSIGSNPGFGANNASNGVLNITGTCTGGPTTGVFGANNASTGTMLINGVIQASEFAAGVGGANRAQVTLLTGPFLISPTFGVNPIACNAWRWASALNNQTYIEVGTQTLLQKRNLVTPDNATNFPAASNVRSGITYGIGGVVTGTCAVPSPAAVAMGTPVDNTVGTLTISVPTASEIATAVWGASTKTITGGVVDTLTNAPTVPTPSQIASQVRTELTSELSNLDASISSRLAGSAYTAPANSDISVIKAKTDNLPSDPADQSLVESAISALSIPTVVQIRTEMDSNSTKLANLDATISSRSTLTTGDLPSVPSAASVASAVRTELTELSNLDASVSSRLASAAYTAPTSAPTAAAVASAVRTELTEISNLDASVSSRLASASYTAPANSDISAIKSKTDNLPASPAAVSDIPTTAQIATAVEGSLLNEGDGQAVLNALVGAIGNQNVDEIALVAAIRSDLERSGGKLDSIPTDAAPSAASVASAVWSASTKEITGGVVDTLTNSPDVPTEAEIASQVRTELSVELGRIDAAISSRLAPSGTLATVTTLTNAPTVPTAAAIADEVRVELATELARLDAPVSGATAPSAATVASQVRTELTAELAKVSALNTERLANVATTAIVGNLLAQANS